MPELPEVETVRKGLADRLAFFEINNLEVCRERTIASPGGSQEFISMLKGAHVGHWQRRGKYLLASLHRKELKDTNNNHKPKLIDWGLWGVHLRMTGHFQWYEKKSSTCAHTRVRFWNKRGEELRFVDVRSFGQMWWVPPDVAPENIITGLKKLGPEPFSESFNAIYLQERLKGKKRPIKSALLDQSLVAGTGNIYADESLFEAKILPNKPSGELSYSELENLCSSLTKILQISIGKGGTTFSDFRDIEGINGNYGGQAFVYRRGGKPCRSCGTTIKRESLSGRSTHWCPNCQH